MYLPISVFSPQRCWFLSKEDEKDGCFDNILPCLSASPCVNSHQASSTVFLLTSVYNCSYVRVHYWLNHYAWRHCLASSSFYPWIPWHWSIFILFPLFSGFKGKIFFQFSHDYLHKTHSEGATALDISHVKSIAQIWIINIWQLHSHSYTHGVHLCVWRFYF